jgi:hypothetical protein
MSMFANANIIDKAGMLDVEVLEMYITDNLNGVIGEEYKNPNPRITFTEGKTNESSHTFDDIAEDSEYADAVKYVLDSGIMTGVSENVFAPEEKLNRAMAVTAIWRAEGCPIVNYALGFGDVASDSWYTEAIRWAASEGIVNGYSDKEFNPNDIISREQLATVMWRYAKYKDTDVSIGENTNILSYEDFFSVSKYAVPAFQWTCGSGIMSGNTTSTLAPAEPVNRIIFASVLYNYLQSIKN